MAGVRHLAKLKPHKTLFLCCDVQENFRKAVPLFGNMIKNIGKLLQVGRSFEVPLIATEQYPKGLGHTAKELEVSNAIAIIPKTQFSMYVPELLCYLKESMKEKPNDVVLFGLETHVCVLQTSMDFLDNDYRVHIVADCCASRTNQDRDVALHLMRQIGCFVQTSESIIFNLLQDKDNPKFGSVKKAVKSVSENMGLAKKKDKKKSDKKGAKKKGAKKTTDKKKADKKSSSKKIDAKKKDSKKSPTKKFGSNRKPVPKKSISRCPLDPVTKKKDSKESGKRKPDETPICQPMPKKAKKPCPLDPVTTKKPKKK